MNGCRLCSIDFDTAELLDEHIAASNEHRDKLACFQSTSQSVSVINRAAERRDKYGIEVPAEDESETQSSIDWNISQTDLPHSITDDNKGAQLLRKMGWKEGKGLGATGSGMTEPIRVQKRPKGLGLGHYHSKS